jgi:ABC-type phosphate transport system permease subunit
MEGLPIFREISVPDFVFGEYWYPTDDPADFGISPLIVASLVVTAVSSVISIIEGEILRHQKEAFRPGPPAKHH